jgi:hypothetical protein
MGNQKEIKKTTDEKKHSKIRKVTVGGSGLFRPRYSLTEELQAWLHPAALCPGRHRPAAYPKNRGTEILKNELSPDMASGGINVEPA